MGSVATIGRLQQFPLPSQITALRTAYGIPAGPWSTQAFGGFSEDFFRAAEASSVISIDASAYEGAEIVHDMNAPIPPELECKFDLVVDGGSIEHIFARSRAGQRAGNGPRHQASACRGPVRRPAAAEPRLRGRRRSSHTALNYLGLLNQYV
ncbi:MAG: hypothetical protein ACLP50_24265 [Solirubrobacteraceae bacterium]